MKIFLDTADIEEIRTVARWGDPRRRHDQPDPVRARRAARTYEEVLKEICTITSGPVSAEVVAEDVEGMLTEGRAFAKLAPNIVVKVPMSEEGLEAMSRFAEEGIKTNCTLIFTANQGLLAAKAGASLLSPFVGRLDDINQDGMIVIRELAEIVAIHELDTEVLAASIRNPLHMTQAALAGAHIATLPFKVLQQMVHHPLTDKGIVQFRSDWEKAAQGARREGRGDAEADRLSRTGADAPVATAGGTVGGRAVAATEEILGQFLGDETFPVDLGLRGREGLLLGLRRPAHPAPGQPDVLRHRRLVAELRPHVPPVRDAVRGRLAGQERQRLRLHDGHPGRSRPPHRGHRVQLALPGAASRATPRSHDDGRLPRHGPAGLRPSTSPTGGATGSCPRCSATSRTSRSELDAADEMTLAETATPPRGRDRHPRSPLEDPLDAQLRPAVGDAQPARGDGADARLGRRGAAGPAPELGLGPQLGLDRGALADEERGPRRPRAARGLRARGRRRRSRPALRATERGRRFIAERIEPYQREFGWHAVWSHEFIFPTVREQMEPVLELVRGYLDDRLRLPERDRGDAPRHRGGVARRSSRASTGDALEEMRAANAVNLRMAPLTPDHHFYIDQGANAHVRLVLLAVGRKLVDAGRLDQPDDVLFLRYNELRGAHRERRRDRRPGRSSPTRRARARGRRSRSTRATGSARSRRRSSPSRTSSTGATRSASTASSPTTRRR